MKQMMFEDGTTLELDGDGKWSSNDSQLREFASQISLQTELDYSVAHGRLLDCMFQAVADVMNPQSVSGSFEIDDTQAQIEY